MPFLLLLKGVLFNKYVMGGIVALAVLWGAYHWAYGRGVQSQQPQIIKLKLERDDFKGKLEFAKINAQNQQEAYTRASEQAKKDYSTVLAQVRTQLDAAAKREKSLKEKLNAATIHSYVTPTADSACSIPLGFIRLHNLAADSGATPATETPAVPGGGLQDVDAPSGIALSTVAEVVTGNYLSCQTTRSTLAAWQKWYAGSLATWVKAVQVQSDYVTLTPP